MVALANIKDLVTLTEKAQGKNKFTDLTSDVRRFTVLPGLFSSRRHKMNGGKSIDWPVIIGHGDSAKGVGYFEEDTFNIADHAHMASVDWKNITTNYGYDVKEKALQGDEYQILDVVKMRRHDVMIDLYTKFEKFLWGNESSTSKLPHGIQHWVVSDTGTAGFNGGNPSGYTAGAGGIDSDDQPRWANWTGQYTSYSKTSDTGLLYMMREAAKKTNFVAPIDAPSYGKTSNSAFNEFKVYLDWYTLAGLERAMEDVNDNLGRDLAMFQGKTTFRGNPMVDVPAFESGNDVGLTVPDYHPVYLISWPSFDLLFQKGRWMKKTGPNPHPLAHDTFLYFIDITCQLRCTNRRDNAVLVSSTD